MAKRRGLTAKEAVARATELIEAEEAEEAEIDGSAMRWAQRLMKRSSEETDVEAVADVPFDSEKWNLDIEALGQRVMDEERELANRAESHKIQKKLVESLQGELTTLSQRRIRSREEAARAAQAARLATEKDAQDRPLLAEAEKGSNGDGDEE
jgi:hypothetical protein